MNVINFGEMRIRNFKSVGTDEVVFNWKDLPGMSYVKGVNLDIPELSNGVGKSVVFVDALLMVLFGKIANNTNNADLFNRASQDNIGWIKLSLEVNMQEYNIHCILNRSPKSGNVSVSFSLYKGEINEETDITKSSKAGTLKYISEEIIKSDIDTFKNSVILSTSNIQNFFQLPKGVKESYLESVFKLEAFGQVYADVRKRSNSLKKELSGARELLETVKEQVNDMARTSDKFEEERKAELAVLKDKIKANKAETKRLTKSKKDAAELEAQHKQLTLETVRLNDELIDLKADQQRLIDKISDPSAIAPQYNEYEEAINEALKVEYAAIEKTINEAEAEIEDNAKIWSDYNDQLLDKEAEKDKVEAKLTYLDDNVKKLTQEQSKIASEIAGMETVRKSLQKAVSELCAECAVKTSANFDFDKTKYEESLTKHKEIGETITALLDAVKPFADEISKLSLKIEGLTSQLETTENSNGYFTEEINQANQDRLVMQEEAKAKLAEKERSLLAALRVQSKEDINKNDSKMAMVVETIQNKVDDANRISTEVFQANQIEKDIKSLESILTDINTTFEAVQSKDNPFSVLLSKASDKETSTRETLNKIFQEQRTNELLANIYDENGVKKHIVSNIVASLNILIKKYLAEMGTSYTVVFDDQFKYIFYTITGECDYFSFSSGERRRLDMAVMLSFRDILFTNGFVTNILIVDEVLDSGIDGYALFAIINILKNKTKDSNLGCVIISHRNEILEELTETFERVLTVEKHNNTTRLLLDSTVY